MFTSTTLYMWLRDARRNRRIFIVAPIVLGSLATWSVLDQPEISWLRWATAVFALLAGLFPAIYEALKLDAHVEGIARQAAQFKNLQDRFRQCRSLGPGGEMQDFRSQFETLMSMMEDAREQSITPPEKYFEQARAKIESGHYSFRADNAPE